MMLTGRRNYLVIALPVLFFLLCACAPTTPRFSDLPVPSRFTPHVIDAAPFTLHALLKTGTGTTLRIYFEGDGRVYATRHRVASDPTPRNPVARALALADPSENVGYVVRPCQYALDGPCATDNRYWTTARYGPEVVRAMNQAVDRLKLLARAETVELAGFSGGGSLAVLVAAKRDDVVGIITVAGNIDLTRWTALLHAAPLAQSLDPADAAPELRGTPRLHFVGGEDDLVPPAVAKSFEQAVGDGLGTIVVVPGQGHGCCWPEVWETLLRENPMVH